MKNIAIYFCFWLCVFISTFANGQSTFEYVSAIADTDQFVSDGISYGNGDMIFVGTNQGGSALQGHILSLSSNGTLLRERMFNWHGMKTYLENILYLDTNRILVVGAFEERNIYHLLIFLIDTALNEISSKELSLGPHNFFMLNHSRITIIMC